MSILPGTLTPAPAASYNTVPQAPPGHVRPVVFLDIGIGVADAGRIKIELFDDLVPKTCENFRQLCTGEFKRMGRPTGYKGAVFHRIIKDFMVQGGDFLKGDGTGSISIYGDKFSDEDMTRLKHTGPGLLSMANSGPNTNGSQFFITCKDTEFLNGKHCIFGIVTDGLMVLRKMEAVPTGAANRPRLTVKIIECGEM